MFHPVCRSIILLYKINSPAEVVELDQYTSQVPMPLVYVIYVSSTRGGQSIGQTIRVLKAPVSNWKTSGHIRTVNFPFILFYFLMRAPQFFFHFTTVFLVYYFIPRRCSERKKSNFCESRWCTTYQCQKTEWYISIILNP